MDGTDAAEPTDTNVTTWKIDDSGKPAPQRARDPSAVPLKWAHDARNGEPRYIHDPAIISRKCSCTCPACNLTLTAVMPGHLSPRAEHAVSGHVARHSNGIRPRYPRTLVRPDPRAANSMLCGHGDASTMCATCRPNDDLHTLIERYERLHQALKRDVLKLVPTHL